MDFGGRKKAPHMKEQEGRSCGKEEEEEEEEEDEEEAGCRGSKAGYVCS